ncbi:MAG: DNA primase [Firmicutes bacterium HGW-Firmicutes-1]|jgi:DNA primase|nr:MAG: DNA primase [Firmicutes bacterium HGW-Firmicutes-1]
MFYPDELVEEIRYQNDIVEVISQYVRLNKKGTSHFGLCPFHNEKTPSFSVAQDKQIYHCFGCGAGGNVITFVMEYENYSFVEAIKALADRVNISLPEPEISEEMRRMVQYKQQLYDANKEAAKYFYHQTNVPLGKKASDYLNDRGIESETRKKFGLGFSHFFRDDLYQYLKGKGYADAVLTDSGLVLEDKSKPGEVYDRFFNRVMFPIFDIHNRVIGFGGRVLGDGMPKYLNSPETKLFDKSKNLYGLNIARTSRRNNIILVEGYMDVISLHQAGFDNTVASLGTAFTQGQSNLLKRYTNEVIIAYDSDKAGINAILKAIPIMEASDITVRVLKMLPYKDPDDFIKAEGAERFEEIISSSIPSFMFEVEQLEAKYNLSDPDHKTKFYQSIAKKLVELENEIKRDSYFEAMINRYSMNPKALQSEMEKIGKDVGIVTHKREDAYSEGKIKNRLSKDSIEVAQKNILTFIVSHKDIFEAVRPYIKPLEFVDGLYSQVAGIIFELYEENLELNPAMIINKFIELEQQNKVAQIFNNDVKVENGMQFEKMVNESVQILKNAYIDKMSGQITDIKDLQDLIKVKRQLQDLYISLNHG